ncbi:MAG: hypothetical protein JJT85_10580, partial [Chromatiales bacterium]|nr:hypothetical protein [Chromatiales bacterium]
ARPLIAPGLAGAHWMVRPRARWPAAAGQAVLTLECRAADGATRAWLGPLHDPASAAAVAAEDAALSHWPQAMRASLGATAVRHEQLGLLCYLHGQASENAAPVRALHWQSPPPPGGPVVPWNGSSWRSHSRREHWRVPLEPAPALFIAHWQAARAQRIPDGTRIWTSGVASWRALAAEGHWVEGCADHLGFDHVKPLLATPVLGLPALTDWTALTHEDAVASWSGSGVGRVLASYRVSSPDDPAIIQALRAEARGATHFYWHSSLPLALLHDVLPATAHHATGPGKTAAALAGTGLAPVMFPGHMSWQAWLGSD